MKLKLVMVVLLWAGSAQAALTLNSVGGEFESAVGGVGVIYPPGEVRWGIPLYSAQSGLAFAGAFGGLIDVDAPFLVGELTHFNYVVAYGSAATAVDLGIELNIDSASPNPQEFLFTFAIDETLNFPGPVDDRITFSAPSQPQTFQVGGVDYTLELLGFGSSPATLVTEFVSPEGGTNAATLWGKIAEPAIPAPSAVLLGGFGAVLVGWVRRRTL